MLLSSVLLWLHCLHSLCLFLYNNMILLVLYTDCIEYNVCMSIILYIINNFARPVYYVLMLHKKFELILIKFGFLKNF